MKKLSLYERLLKNKNRLKVQAVSLVLATTAVVTTGCGKTDIVHPDVPKPGVEDVIAPNVDLTSEEIETLTAENFDEEAAKIAENMKSKGYEREFVGLKSVLLNANAFDFSNEDGKIIFGLANETNLVSYLPYRPSLDFLNIVYDYNCDNETKEKRVNLAQFSYNKTDRAMLKYFDELVINFQELSDNNDTKQMETTIKFINDFVSKKASIKIDGENLYLDDFSPFARILVDYDFLCAKTVALRCDTDSKIIKGFTDFFSDEYMNELNDCGYKIQDKTETFEQQKTFG